MIRHATMLGLSLLLLWRVALAHPAHISMTEMEWNPAAGNFEISLKLAPEDLELALSHFNGRSMTLAGEQSLDSLLRELIAARFHLIAENDQSLTLNWVGYEISHQAAWLYFEFKPSTGQSAFRLSNRLLLKARPQQVNTVNLKATGQQQTFRFHSELIEAEFRLPQLPSGDGS